MAKKDFGLVVVGNALVDILSQESDGFIKAHKGMQKGAMNLIDTERGHQIYDAMGPATEMSGGSVANSLSVFASFGGSGVFIGKIADDEFGEVFSHDLKAQGITFTTKPYQGDLQTGRSYIVVTPDKQRTMNTYLGASTEISETDIDEELIVRSEILLLEGYLMDKPKAKQAFKKAASFAKQHGTKVAFTLSDHNCVGRHHQEFMDLVRNDVDILIGNEEEIQALTLTETFEDAAQMASGLSEIAVLTKGKDGALIINNGERYEIPTFPPEKIVDTTGAGDAFAGGVLYGFSAGMTPDEAGVLGAKAASKTISHIGARNPDTKFKALLP